MRLFGHQRGKFLRVLFLFLAGWGVLRAQPASFSWPPPLPAPPYALGDNSANAATAADQPVPGFVGPAGDGVTPNFGQNTDQYVNPAFVEWASSVADYSPAKPALINPDYSNPETALGPVTGNVFDVVSLGDLAAADIAAGAASGSITLVFSTPIGDGPGPDFVVFGNAFKLNSKGREMVFSKLAYVEVSSDGVNFARFPCVDGNPKPKQNPWSYMVADPTLIYNLFGKALNGYGVSWGVPFDLAQLAGHPLTQAGLLNLQNVRYVRFVAVVGNGVYSTDSLGQPIYDPWPTSGSPGPEVQAVGVLNTSSASNSGASSPAGAGKTTAASAPGPTAAVRANRANSPSSNRNSGFYFGGFNYLDANATDSTTPEPTDVSILAGGNGTVVSKAQTDALNGLPASARTAASNSIKTSSTGANTDSATLETRIAANEFGKGGSATSASETGLSGRKDAHTGKVAPLWSKAIGGIFDENHVPLAVVVLAFLGALAFWSFSIRSRKLRSGPLERR